jgi:hypothetical protein
MFTMVVVCDINARDRRKSDATLRGGEATPLRNTRANAKHESKTAQRLIVWRLGIGEQQELL